MFVGGAVAFFCNALLLPGDDDVMGVTAGIDDIAEIGCGEVVEVSSIVGVAGFLPLLLHHALPAFNTLGVFELAAFLLSTIIIFCFCSIHVVGDILE